MILDDDGIIDATEELALRQANVFTFEDFTGQFTGLRDAAVMGIETVTDALANHIDETNFTTNVDAFRNSINAAGQTIADVNTAWQTFVENTLRSEFDRLRGLILDDNGIISVAEELALRQANVFTFEDFSGQFIGLRDAAVTGIETAQAAAQTTANRQGQQNADRLQREAERARQAAERAREAIIATQEALADYVASSAFDSNVEAFSSSITEVIDTVEGINAAWNSFVENTLRPEFERIRDVILDDNGITSAAEELALRQANVFTFEDFTGQFSGLRDAAIESIQNAETALANYTADSEFEGNVNAFRESLSAAGNTVADVNTAWGNFVENMLRPEFDRLRGLILDDDGIIDATEELALRQANVFTFEDFTGQFIGLRDAAVMGIETVTEALANYVSESGFESNVNAFRTSITEAGNTIADVNSAWAGFIENTLRPEFDRLRGLILDDDGIISVAEELALRQAGVYTFDDFTMRFIGIKDAAVMGIETATDALANYVADSGFEQNVNAFGSSIREAGNTIEGIDTAWATFQENVLRPEFERLRGLILDDNGIISVAEELALRRAGVFTFEDFSGQFIGLRDAAVMGIESTETALANYIAGSGFESNVNAFREGIIAVGQTIEDVNTAWAGFVENTLRPEYDRLRGLILDDDGITSAAEELALRQANVFTFEDFTGQFTGLRDAAVSGIETANQSSQQRGLRSQSNLSQNAIQRGRFFLSDATDESDFEVRRDRLIGLTNDYYDDELTRINGLMLSEGELQDVREDNQLMRIKDLRDLDNLENSFAEDRIRREREIAREQEALFGRQQRRDAQFSDIQLGGARDQQDLNLQFRRSIEDIDPGFFTQGSGRVTSAGGFTDALRGIIDATDPAYRSNENILSQLSEQFGVNFATNNLGTGRFTQGLLPLIRQFTRGSEDIAIDSGRQEADFLSSIAAEDANNQWKSDIAAIAANTSQMDMFDPLLEPDSERIDPLMSDPLMDRTGLEGMTEAGQMQLEMASGLEASAQAVSNSAVMLAASASHLMGAGDALYVSAAHLGSLTIPAPAGGGGVVLMAEGRQIATVVNDANVSLGASGGIVGGGGGGNGGGGSGG